MPDTTPTFARWALNNLRDEQVLALYQVVQDAIVYGNGYLQYNADCEPELTRAHPASRIEPRPTPAPHGMAFEPVLWITDPQWNELQGRKRDGESHTTLQVRIDRGDGYHRLGLILGEAR